jgi:hypothetical protein
MTPARRAALKAFRDYLEDFDGEPEDQSAFIAGYLRGRGEAHQCELERNQAIERLTSVVDGTQPSQWTARIQRMQFRDGTDD